MSRFSEGVAEEALLEWFSSLGYAVARGPDIAPGEPAAERTDYREVVLVGRLRDALRRVNPDLPADALRDAERALLRPDPPEGALANRRFHRMLVDGVEVEVASGGAVRGRRVRSDTSHWIVVLCHVRSSARRPGGQPQRERAEVPPSAFRPPIAVAKRRRFLESGKHRPDCVTTKTRGDRQAWLQWGAAQPKGSQGRPD